MTIATFETLHDFVTRLSNEEEYDDREGCWHFRSGGDCCRCADSAMKIVNEFGGRVVGYYCSKNPTAAIGTRYGEGHDFAFVSEHFVVDYWAFRVACIIADPVLDLSEMKDRDLVKSLYGDQSTWEEVLAAQTAG